MLPDKKTVFVAARFFLLLTIILSPGINLKALVSSLNENESDNGIIILLSVGILSLLMVRKTSTLLISAPSVMPPESRNKSCSFREGSNVNSWGNLTAPNRPICVGKSR